MYIKPFEISDLSFLANVQPHDWQDISPYFKFYLSTDYCFPIKVISENKLIGTGAIIVHEDVAWLAHIIVSQDHRNKGVGRLITQHLIDLARSRSCTTLYLTATDMGAPVYEKLGFATETEYLFFKDLKTTDPDFSSEYIVPFDPTHEKEIIALDRLVSGENRTPHLREHMPFAFIFQKNNRVQGYFLPSLSEGHIVANTSEAGIELLKMKLRDTDKLVFPKVNVNAMNFMYAQGYREFKIMKRMRLGIARPVQLDKMYSRIGGYLG